MDPGASEVRIRAVAASVNFADIKARQGLYHNGGKLPFVPGLDVAGIVDAMGSDVTGLHIGQRVIAFPQSGSYSEYTIADRNLVYALPEEVGWEEAAAVPTVFVTAHQLLTTVTRLMPGETVLVHAAAGGVGTAAVQLARYLGAGTVIGTVGSDIKLDIARQYGADHVFNYARESFAEAVLKATYGRGVDIILDSVGGDEFAENFRCLAPYGRIAVFGNASGRYGAVSGSELHGSCRAVLGYSMGTTRRLRPETLLPSVTAVLELVRDKTLKVLIGARFALEDAGVHKMDFITQPKGVRPGS
jgi:NADPH2:quinone reductase